MRPHAALLVLLTALGMATVAATPPPTPNSPDVQILRAKGAEATVARVQGALLAAAAWQRPGGRPGLALLTAANRDGTGARTLSFVEPGRPVLEPLPAPPEGSDALTAFDLDGDGTAELIAGAPGALFALTGDAAGHLAFRKVLDAPGLGLQAGDPRPTSTGWLTLAGAGRVEVASPREGRLVRGAGFPLPLIAQRRSWGLRLSSPDLHLLPAAGGAPAIFCAGPRAEGRRRLATTLLPLAGTPAEAWSKLPGEEDVAESSYQRWDGKPALVVATYGRIGLSERKRLRIFLPMPDRTREGRPPAVARGTGCAIWQRLEATLRDLDGDGRQDLVLLHPEGLRGKSLHVEVAAGQEGGRFSTKPIARSLSVTPDAWAWGTDFDGDGLPDLALLTDQGRLQLHPGDRRDRLPAARPAWSIPLAPLHPARLMELGVGGDAQSSFEPPPQDAARPAEAIFEMLDLTGDGRPEILVTGADFKGGVRIAIVRQTR
jgi:VCBS repeat protein